MVENSIEQTKQKYELDWMKIPGVEGVGITEKKGERVIVVYISYKSKEIGKKIPKDIDNYKIVLEKTGGFRAF